MFVALSNTPRDYAWGSLTAIANLIGSEASGKPEAELWFGAHPASPSRIVDPGLTGGAETLNAWIEAEPLLTLGVSHGETKRLPFLLKVLAIDAPLSLQAHPSPDQAIEGFLRENAAGVALDAPNRNYRDAYAKPELVYALSATFDALCGFRSLAVIRELIAEGRAQLSGALAASDDAALTQLSDRAADGELADLVEWLSSGTPDVIELIDVVTRLAVGLIDPADRFAVEYATVRLLAEQYPGDPGIVISLLMNRVTLERGEVLFLPAGNIHAYLRGVGVELMTSSDNVLRGGLTPKHVDVPELMRVLDFSPVETPYLDAERPGPGIEIFRPDVSDFVLAHFDGSVESASVSPNGPAIALCTAGTVTISGTASITVARGDAFFITPDEGALTISGGGELFLASAG